MEFGKESWRTFERGIEKEWLLTNGIGGFASSTVIGANTRRYHGLLVASLKPPVSRHLVLSKLDESIMIGNRIHHIYSFQTPDYVMRGYDYLQRAVLEPIPTFTYAVEDAFIEKKVCMVYGENTVIVFYKIITGSNDIKLRLTPLVNFRDYHHNSGKDFLKFKQRTYEQGVVVKPDYYDIDINLYCGGGSFTPQEHCFFTNMYYAVEHERGLSSTEDHFIPGFFDIEVGAGEVREITFVATVEKEIKDIDGAAIIRNEVERLRKLIVDAGYRDALADKLVRSADYFIVQRKSTAAKTIIAGYPWFTDWGRDTMISLTGLTLATKRFHDAREILLTFSKYVKNGLVPNMFPDEGQEPAYNTVDAALWYFEAVNNYIRYTHDMDFVFEKLYKVLKEIIYAYMEGTLFNIKMDADYLITAGDEGIQLTWMDAKVGQWVVTPRHGKAVEINALWYNALQVMAVLSREYGEDPSNYRNLAERVKNSFEHCFWNSEGKYLYDVITGDFKDDRVRSNQILAVALANPVIEGEKAKYVVDRVWRELYTAYGLRSLSPGAGEYAGTYYGDPHRRDGAYHQGTVWTWPLGFFITAYMRVYGNIEEGRKTALKFLQPLKDHLYYDACIGSISEIFDGNEPHIPRGCFAQAWSVAEMLRAYVEDVGIPFPPQ